MGNTFNTIRIYSIDKERLRAEVKKEFLSHNPKFNGMKLTDHFLIKKVLDYYLDKRIL